MSSENNQDQSTQEIFKQLRQLEVEPSPYLKTRVLAIWKEKKKPKLHFGWLLALGSGTACFILAIIIAYNLGSSSKIFVAPVSEAVAIRLNIEDYKSVKADSIQISLGKGVEFYSKNHDLSDQKDLLLDWETIVISSKNFPIVVKSSENGIRQIQIAWMNGNKEVLRKEILIKFENGRVL